MLFGQWWFCLEFFYKNSFFTRRIIFDSHKLRKTVVLLFIHPFFKKPYNFKKKLEPSERASPVTELFLTSSSGQLGTINLYKLRENYILLNFVKRENGKINIVFLILVSNFYYNISFSLSKHFYLWRMRGRVMIVAIQMKCSKTVFHKI